MPMTQLETTLISLARENLDAIKRFFAAVASDEATPMDEYDHMAYHGALTDLLKLAHMTECGIGEEAKAELLKIEAEHAAECREFKARKRRA